MKRNNFLKAFLAIPFVAPLIAKAEDYPIIKGPIIKEKGEFIKRKDGLMITDYQLGGIPTSSVFIPSKKDKEPHVWKEEDIKAGLYLKSTDAVMKGIFIIQKRTNMHGLPVFVIVDCIDQIEVSIYTDLSDMPDLLNYPVNKLRPATKAEVIEMIVNSDKNFI